jgi:hypothetical protein
MLELTTCANCNNEVTDDSDFCPHCGYLFKEAPPVHCETDLDQEATGVCIICQKLVCPRCREVRNNHLFCINHGNVVVREDWAVVFESRSTAEAELVKNYFDANSIQSLTQNVSLRARSRDLARVFVPIPEYLRAQKMLDELDKIA